MKSWSWAGATGAQIASSVADAGVAVRNQPTPNYAVNAAVRLARSRGGERAWRVSGSGAPFTIPGACDDVLLTAGLPPPAPARPPAAGPRAPPPPTPPPPRPRAPRSQPLAPPPPP